MQIPSGKGNSIMANFIFSLLDVVLGQYIPFCCITGGTTDATWTHQLSVVHDYTAHQLLHFMLSLMLTLIIVDCRIILFHIYNMFVN